MGYLSQKKKHARESRFLHAATIIFCLLTLFLFLPENFLGIKNWLFQIYLILLLVFAYALFIGRFLYAGLMAFLLVLNYFLIASSAHLFFNAGVKPEHELELFYAPESVLEISAPEIRILRRGHLVLGEKNIAPFVAVEQDAHELTIIRVYLRKLSAKKRRIALQQLHHFISEQDNPVVLYGDFGVPAWSQELESFMENTRLEVKNRLLFTDKGKRYNFLRAPGFYVLSFQNIGINDLSVKLPENKKSYPLINIRLGYY